MFKNENLTILYGSQTGNAQDLAETIWRESKRFYFCSIIKPMDNYNISELINEKCCIFVCSTTGQGEEPSNMKMFWRFLLRRNLPLNSLINLKFAVFGLGDSSYAKFNFAAKKLYKRLIQLGGQPLLNLGLGDDQHDLGYDAAADPWIENLWSNLLYYYPLPNGIQCLDKNLPIIPRWNVNTHNSIVNENQSIYYSTKKTNEFLVTVIENTRTTEKNHFQDVRLIKLKSNGQFYNSGDILVLRPRNLPWQIEEFKKTLRENDVIIDDKSVFNLNAKESGIPLPEVLHGKNITFEKLCEEYFDLMAVPRRFTFNILSMITDSDLEKEKCLEFTTAEGQNDLYSYVNRPKRNIVEVLQDFPNATKNLTPELLFEILSPIKAREFSIASSYKANKNELHILVAVVKYKTKLIKDRFGLASNYLANLNVGDEVLSWIKQGNFRFPSEKEPVIMVGPGTGVAPFRSFILERNVNGKANQDNTLLFFGCRKRDADFHCKEEFLALENSKKIKLITAFSREQDYKIYIQDKILENKNLVWNYLKVPGYIFVAGNSKQMPESVRQAFLKVCIECGKMDEAEAENYLKNLEKSNKYQTECWS